MEKTIRDAWNNYQRLVLSDTEPSSVAASRRAFYSGVRVTLSVLSEAANKPGTAAIEEFS